MSDLRTGRPILRRLAVGLVIALTVVPVAAGCSDAAPDPPPSAAPAATPGDEPADALVTVAPGRDLAVSCSGSGDPTVFYLHGLIQPTDDASWAHAPEIRALVSARARYCEYERTNVGASSRADGPIPVTESVADLDAILKQLNISEPVILLGGSFGGLIAYTYAGTHPDRVAGLVLLDPTLPDEPALERAHLPEQDWMSPDSWQDSAEKIDTYRAYAVAQQALRSAPAVPGTIFVTKELWAPDGKTADQFRRDVRSQQKDLVEHFEPATTITVDTPHAMAGEVPDQIADAVLAIHSQLR